MKKLLVTIIVLASSAVVALAQLKNATGNELVKTVKNANDKVKTINCKFNQQNNLAMVSQVINRVGNFYLTKNDKLAMRYEDGEYVVINGSSVTLGKASKRRNLKSSNKHVSGLVNALFSSVTGDLEKLDGSLKSSNKTNSTVSFVVEVDFVVGKGVVKELQLVYNTKDYTIDSIKMLEANGNYTFYELQPKTINKDIDETVYVVK